MRWVEKSRNAYGMSAPTRRSHNTDPHAQCGASRSTGQLAAGLFVFYVYDLAGRIRNEQ